jgi:hypothetical protein
MGTNHQDYLRLLYSLTREELKGFIDPPPTSTISGNFSWKIYLTTLANTIKTSLPVPIALTLIAALKGQRLEDALGEIAGTLLAASVPGYWMEWYKIKYRLTPEFYLKNLTVDTVFEEGTLYLFHVSDENETQVLYYMALGKNNQLDIKKINQKNQIFDSIIAKVLNREDLTAEESRQIRQAVDARHTPMLKPDAPYVPGEVLDSSFFWKCFGSLILSSTVAGGLLGWAIGKPFGIVTQGIFAFILAVANFIKNMMIDAIIIFSAYARSCPGIRLASLPRQPRFALIYNQFSLALLRNWAPALLSILSIISVAQLLRPVNSYLALGVCIFLYPFITSSFRIFTLDAAQKQLTYAGIKFSTENSFSKMNNPIARIFGEILSCRATTVSLPLRCAMSPIAITYTLMIGAIIGAVMLLWTPINDDVLCPSKNCFGQGQGTLASFIISAKTLDAESQSNHHSIQAIFVIIVAALVIATAYGMFSLFANIREYIENRPEYTSKTQGDYETVANPANTNNSRVIFNISDDPTTLFNSDGTPMTSADMLNLISAQNQNKLSTISFATLFGNKPAPLDSKKLTYSNLII